MTETKISNDLIEAYKGYYEDELERDHRPEWHTYVKKETQANNEAAVESFDSWVNKHVKARIQSDTPKQRLEVYLEWNGIIGYTNRVYEIATGEL